MYLSLEGGSAFENLRSIHHVVAITALDLQPHLAWTSRSDRPSTLSRPRPSVIATARLPLSYTLPEYHPRRLPPTSPTRPHPPAPTPTPARQPASKEARVHQARSADRSPKTRSATSASSKRIIVKHPPASIRRVEHRTVIHRNVLGRLKILEFALHDVKRRWRAEWCYSFILPPLDNTATASRGEHGTLHRIVPMRRAAPACPSAAFAPALTPTPPALVLAPPSRSCLPLPRVALMRAHPCTTLWHYLVFAPLYTARSIPLHGGYAVLRGGWGCCGRTARDPSGSVERILFGSRFLQRGARARRFLHARIALMLSPAPSRSRAPEPHGARERLFPRRVIGTHPCAASRSCSFVRLCSIASGAFIWIYSSAVRSQTADFGRSSRRLEFVGFGVSNLRTTSDIPIPSDTPPSRVLQQKLQPNKTE
ncbi:hypothetical protein C8J57DRAFT_1581800 [Mycena rebaudengoi]|nr:hypothetical protein C8J57DRAFT_1581800 [Mycena rebaudengoi]